MQTATRPGTAALLPDHRRHTRRAGSGTRAAPGAAVSGRAWIVLPVELQPFQEPMTTIEEREVGGNVCVQIHVLDSTAHAAPLAGL